MRSPSVLIAPKVSGSIRERTSKAMDMIKAAKRYALADKSDPFALRRAMTHLRTGVAQAHNTNGQEAFYDATPFEETRYLEDGTSYLATVYRNIHRP